jgi:general secretion pathway protein F
MTLDELIALNDEIAALVRAGVPLEAGLAELGGDLPGRLGKFVATLAERTARGESLPQAIADSAGEVPPAYRAVIETGMRAGRLPAALEAVSTSARRLADLQRSLGIAAIYPLLVVMVAWAGTVLFSAALAPRLAMTFRSLDIPGHQIFAAVAWVGRGAWCWGPIGPLAFVALLVAWWLACQRGTLLVGRWGDGLFDRVPWLGRMMRLSRTATFLELVALLVEHQTPLAESVVLAAEASCDRRTLHSARQLAAAIQQGQTRPQASVSAFSPLVNWLLMAAGGDGSLLASLRHAAATYRRRARHQFDLLRLWLPVFLTVVVGGSVTALYALMVSAPYATLIRVLGR